jgi:hypothetical protein
LHFNQITYQWNGNFWVLWPLQNVFLGFTLHLNVSTEQTVIETQPFLYGTRKYAFVCTWTRHWNLLWTT